MDLGIPPIPEYNNPRSGVDVPLRITKWNNRCDGNRVAVLERGISQVDRIRSGISLPPPEDFQVNPDVLHIFGGWDRALVLCEKFKRHQWVWRIHALYDGARAIAHVTRQQINYDWSRHKDGWNQDNAGVNGNNYGLIARAPIFAVTKIDHINALIWTRTRYYAARFFRKHNCKYNARYELNLNAHRKFGW